MKKKLGAMGEVIKGVSFDKGESSYLSLDGYIPILRAGNITEHGLKLDDDIIWVPKSRVSSGQMLKPNDVVICMSSGSAAIVGKSALIRQTWNGSVGAFCAIVRFGNAVNAQYGAYWLRSPEFIQWRDSQAKGANIQNLRKSALEELEISLPPLPEQERIVHLLDEADALRRLRRQANQRMQDFVPALFQEMFGDPARNEKGWKIVPVRSFVKGFQAGKSILTDGKETEDTNYWVLKVSAVTWGQYDAKESKPVPVGYIPGKDHFVRKGDLLFSRANTTELVGATVYVFDTPENRLLSDKLWRFVWQEPECIDPLFVWSLFQSSALRREIGQRATGTGGSMKNISQEKVLAMNCPFPPLSLQRKFATCVQQVRSLQDTQQRSTERIEAAFQSLLARAFAGEL